MVHSIDWNMAGTLYVVATPIGHLDDITLRALRILREVSVVAAEDTRRTVHLLRHYDISTPLESLHEHNEQSRTPGLIRRLLAGESVALVSDAGTPGISDPGALLVGEARTHGIRVEAVPGPSAVMAALSVAGLQSDVFTFMGFPPIRLKDRKQWFRRCEGGLDGTVILFEAPHRIAATLYEISHFVDYPIIVARELTKRFEEVLTGPPAQLAARLSEPRGEFTVVIPPRDTNEGSEKALDVEQLREKICLLTKLTQTSSKREMARLVAEQLGVPTRKVYEALNHRDDDAGPT
jgi:16S rRNA (cytidine1402-2'-O)-methyltransferase